MVELPGIEPGSYGANPVLLRVQFIKPLFLAPVLGRTRHRQAQSRKSPIFTSRHGDYSKFPK